MVKPGSYMAKYDLRDFFWNLKVKRGDTGLMGVVHPGDNKTYAHERLGNLSVMTLVAVFFKSA
jgi:hypothetical protein